MATPGRDERIREAMERTGWDLLVCAMPANVLLLSGYWPAFGCSLALATRDGQILLIAPEDEEEAAQNSWADEVVTYSPCPLEKFLTAEESLYEAFSAVRRRLGLTGSRIGFEHGDLSEPAALAPHLFRGNAVRLLQRAFPAATLAPGDELLADLRMLKTAAETEHIRNACHIAERGFRGGAAVLGTGLTEAQTAAAFRLALLSGAGELAHVRRFDGFVCCGRSRARRIEANELVTVHIQCYADGYWAEATRTYHLGPLDSGQRRMCEAVLAARDAALQAIRPGALASSVDRAARAVLEEAGFGTGFRHPAGHGSGFGVMDYAARPRLHPRSDDLLEAGMVLTLAPGVTADGAGSMRAGDMVAVTESGPEVLTPFHWTLDQLEIRP
ncbi:MAG: Xaa-Pro peptidase family protein [Acidobacteriota bacterium]